MQCFALNEFITCQLIPQIFSNVCAIVVFVYVQMNFLKCICTDVWPGYFFLEHCKLKRVGTVLQLDTKGFQWFVQIVSQIEAHLSN
jgi:hypothetical protein